MNNGFKIVAVLVGASLLSGGFLSVVYQKTKPGIEYQELKALREAVFSVLPDTAEYKEIRKGGLIIYQGINNNGKKTGIAFLASGSGFQGRIKMIIGMDQELKKIQGMQVLESIETPGLGGKITGEDFKSQFKGRTIKEKINLVKGAKPGHLDAVTSATIQAITGATISSKAVVDIINQKVMLVQQVMKSGAGE